MNSYDQLAAQYEVSVLAPTSQVAGLLRFGLWVVGMSPQYDPDRCCSAKAATVRDAVVRAALGMARLVPTDLALKAEERARYVGTYDLGPIQVQIEEAGERLILRPVGQAPARLLFQGDDSFLADVGGGVRVEFRVEEGRATGVTLFQGSQPLEGQRTEG